MGRHSTRFLIGTSGWSYAHWHGPFYPHNMRHGCELAYYARHFDSVEINSTFYRLPDRSVLRTWRDAVPGDFVFAVKASRYITHMKKLNAGLCIYELGGFRSPIVVTSKLVYVRLHAPGAPYQGCYDRHALARWAKRIRAWSSEGRSACCYFDNDQLAYAALNARDLARRLARTNPGASARAAAAPSSSGGRASRLPAPT